MREEKRTREGKRNATKYPSPFPGRTKKGGEKLKIKIKINKNISKKMDMNATLLSDLSLYFRM